MPVLQRASGPAPGLLADANWLQQVNNPMRRLALNLGLAFVFVQFTKLHEFLAQIFGFNTYLLNIIGIPAVALVFLSGGFRHALRFRPTRYWIGFLVFLILSVPFSTWKSASLTLVTNYMRAEFIVLFIIGGLIMTWSEVVRLLAVLAGAAVTDALIGKSLVRSIGGGRVDLAGNASMNNANDFAALLILLMPFLLWVVFSAERFILLRIAAGGTFLYCLYFTLATGSRGALVALIVTTVYGWVKLPPRAKIALLLAAALGTLTFTAVLPSTVVSRLSTVFKSSSSPVTDDTTEEAASSAESRNYLLWQSLVTTVQHPIFGIGPGEFSIFEGSMAKEKGQQGAWHDTHNSYTQVSSEVGIPAALFMLAALVSTYFMLARLYKRIRLLPDTPLVQQLRATLFCILLSMVGFCTAIFFLSLAYKFYLPALTGMALAATTALQHDPQVKHIFQKTAHV